MDDCNSLHDVYHNFVWNLYLCWVAIYIPSRLFCTIIMITSFPPQHCIVWPEIYTISFNLLSSLIYTSLIWLTSSAIAGVSFKVWQAKGSRLSLRIFYTAASMKRQCGRIKRFREPSRLNQCLLSVRLSLWNKEQKGLMGIALHSPVDWSFLRNGMINIDSAYVHCIDAAPDFYCLTRFR